MLPSFLSGAAFLRRTNSVVGFLYILTCPRHSTESLDYLLQRSSDSVNIPTILATIAFPNPRMIQDRKQLAFRPVFLLTIVCFGETLNQSMCRRFVGILYKFEATDCGKISLSIA